MLIYFFILVAWYVSHPDNDNIIERNATSFVVDMMLEETRRADVVMQARE